MDKLNSTQAILSGWGHEHWLLHRLAFFFFSFLHVKQTMSLWRLFILCISRVTKENCKISILVQKTTLAQNCHFIIKLFLSWVHTHTQISRASTSRTSQKTKVLHTHTPTSHPLFNVKIPPMWWFSRQFCQDYFIWHKEQIYFLTFSTFPHCLWKQEYNSWLLTSH